MAADKSPVIESAAVPAAASASSPVTAPGNQSPKEAKNPVAASGSNPPSPKSKSTSPREGSPEAVPVIAEILPAQHWVDTAQENLGNQDGDSVIGSQPPTTASLASGILKYRSIHGRTFHSEVGNAEYWGANDERQNESMDINHHVLTLVIDGKLSLAPLEKDKIKNVLDVGTGTGTWAIDFADEYPNAEVIGTDISPIQPGWVPPNLKFEIEDCTLDWTFQPNSMDYIHMRWLVGSVSDWDALYKQAYRALRPGGWLESYEGSAGVMSDDDSIPDESAMGQWAKIFIHFGETIGRSFTVVADGTQAKGMQRAGFVDMEESLFKTPIGTWPKDPKMKEIGEYTHAVVAVDPEGYLMYPATSLGWTPQEVAVYAAHMRKELRDPGFHGYYLQRVVWGRKPLDAMDE